MSLIEVLSTHNCSTKPLAYENLIRSKVSYLEAFFLNELEAEQLVVSLLKQAPFNLGEKATEQWLMIQIQCFLIEMIQKEQNLLLKQQFILENFELGYYFCKQHPYLKNKWQDHSLDGLIYEAMDQAILHFRPKLKKAFSSYCFYFFRHYLIGRKQQQAFIDVPYTYIKQQQKLMEAEEAFYHQFHHYPNTEELSNYMGVSTTYLLKLNQMFHSCRSYQEPIDEETELLTLLEDVRSINPMDYLEEEEKIEKTRTFFLTVLPKEEFQLLKLRYGLYGILPRTMDQLGEEYRLSKSQMITKIKRILTKLRTHPQLKEIAYLWDHPDPEKKEGSIMTGLYQRFPNQTKEEMRELYQNLSEKQQLLLQQRYGSTLEEGPYKVTPQERNRIESCLAQLRKKIAQKQEPKEKTNQPSKREANQNSDLLNLLGKIPTSLDQTNPEHARATLIWKLRTGQIDGKLFTVQEISTTLNMDPEKVQDCLKQTLKTLESELSQLFYQSIL